MFRVCGLDKNVRKSQKRAVKLGEMAPTFNVKLAVASCLVAAALLAVGIDAAKGPKITNTVTSVRPSPKI